MNNSNINPKIGELDIEVLNTLLKRYSSESEITGLLACLTLGLGGLLPSCQYMQCSDEETPQRSTCDRP